MPEYIYSGGRLLALTLAESLAMTNTEVDFIVNKVPLMYDEFRNFSKINIVAHDFSDNFSSIIDNTDVIIIVPHHSQIDIYVRWLEYAKKCNAKLVLLNFETPNWFNKISPFKRGIELWAGWDLISEKADMILSISKEGNKYAKKYYTNTPSHTVFSYNYPSINTILADLANSVVKPKKRIIMLTRVDPHKGYNSLDALVTHELNGYDVQVYLGNGTFEKQELEKWTKCFEKVGVNFEVKNTIIGQKKFELIKGSALLFFPTQFEGFGIPPLEAAYCKTSCACSNLAVLREFGGNALTYGDPNNTLNMRRTVLDALESNDRVISEHNRISEIANMYKCGERLFSLLESIA